MGWWWWAGREPILKSSSITQICSPDTGFNETKVVTALFNFISQEQHTSSHRMDWQWRCLKSSKISYCNSHFTVLVLLSNALNLKIKRKHFGGDQNTFGTPKFGFASSWQESRFSDGLENPAIIQCNNCRMTECTRVPRHSCFSLLLHCLMFYPLKPPPCINFIISPQWARPKSGRQFVAGTVWSILCRTRWLNTSIERSSTCSSGESLLYLQLVISLGY